MRPARQAHRRSEGAAGIRIPRDIELLQAAPAAELWHSANLGEVMLTRFCFLTVTSAFAVVGCRSQAPARSGQAETPVLVVTASYPGANAKVVADTVAAPIEEQVNGVE